MTQMGNSQKRSRNLEDIAARAGVSRSTVSRVINHDPKVSDKTREKVWAVIEQEGFSPNPVARALATNRTNVIGVVIPHSPHITFEDAYYFPTLLSGISKIANKRGYSILLWLRQSEDDERNFHRRIVSNRLMDGLIIASPPQTYSLIDHFLEANANFVMVERPSHHADIINYVTIDNIEVAYAAVSHLVNLGRCRIGTITGNLTITDGVDRFEGYKQALLDGGLTFDNELIYEGNFSYQCGYDGIKALLDKNIDSVFTANDISARGALHALHEAGVRVPEDVAVVSVDDLPTAVQVTPPLTTVHHPIEKKGEHAASILIDLIEGKVSKTQHVVLPTELIVRESCGAYLNVEN
ncbi:MAG: LacI family transcriptional regulator [Chloroflexi bacterium]|nr:LacI family transcriptional regulator [Chloroflexota bacterium]